MNVLVADDQPDCAYMLARLLEQMGCDSFVAHSGVEAIELAAKNRPQAILLDIHLPDMDGYELARRLRIELGLNAARIIALSGGPIDPEKMAKNGIDHAILKPIGVEQFMRLLGSNGTPTKACVL